MGAAATAALFAATSGLGVYFARQVVTPRRNRDENLEILAVIDSENGKQIILPANEDTTVDGTYSLYFDGGAGHARIGGIRSYEPREGTVQRDVEEIYSGDLAKAVRGWWSGAIYPSPSAVGLAEEEVNIPVDGGLAPAWLVRADAGAGAQTWAIMVHGRGAQRTECLRALRTAQQAGVGGWAVTGHADAFTSAGRTVTADHFGWTPRVLTPRPGLSAGDPVPTALSGGPGLDTPGQLASATARGRFGSAVLGAGLVLEVPVDTQPGSYTGTLTISLFPVD